MLLLLLLKHTSEVNIFFGARLDLLDHGEKFCPKCTRGCLGILIPEQTFFGNSTNGIIIIIDRGRYRRSSDEEDCQISAEAPPQPPFTPKGKRRDQPSLQFSIGSAKCAGRLPA